MKSEHAGRNGGRKARVASAIDAADQGRYSDEVMTSSHQNDTPQLGAAQGFFVEGRNCWLQARASRVGVIIDTCDYYRLFAEACARARRQILILGWDFDRREPLFRDSGPADLPWQVGEFLAALVRRRRELHVYLLSWDFNMIYAAERELAPALRLRLKAPRRFHFKLDAQHPMGASHHQKVVVIDDRLAFVGGIDLSRWRWDTRDHTPGDPRRTDPDGKAYAPFHDVMMMVEGEAAARLGDLARTRWRRARGLPVKPVAMPPGAPQVWPRSAPVFLRDVDVAIARTEPRYAGRAATREVQALYHDAIRAARRFIYIENQYFTARSLAEALAARLEEEQGPEVVLVLPQKTGGWLEQYTMDVLRTRVIEKLRAADRFDRLRLYYPHQPGLGDTCISVHAKLLIVDDLLLRIGSSNASSRSLGVDTECDLALAAAGDAEPATAAIRGLRQDLLAEHLGVTPQRVAASEAAADGLIEAIESLRNDDGRSLRKLEPVVEASVDEMVPDSGIIDPVEPLNPDYFVAEYMSKPDRRRGRRRITLFVALIVALLALAAAWRWTPLNEWLSPEQMRDWLATFQSPLTRGLVAVSGFLVASVLMVPLTLLAVLGGLAFGGALGFVYVLVSALASAGLVFLAGRSLSRDAVRRLSGGRLSQLSRRLADRGVLAVAVLRLIPVAPFTVFNLVAGASHLKFRHFLLGSVIGLTPGIGALTLFSDNLWSALRNPSWQSLVGVGAFALLILGAVIVMRRWLRSG